MSKHASSSSSSSSAIDPAVQEELDKLNKATGLLTNLITMEQTHIKQEEEETTEDQPLQLEHPFVSSSYSLVDARPHPAALYHPTSTVTITPDRPKRVQFVDPLVLARDSSVIQPPNPLPKHVAVGTPLPPRPYLVSTPMLPPSPRLSRTIAAPRPVRPSTAPPSLPLTRALPSVSRSSVPLPPLAEYATYTLSTSLQKGLFRFNRMLAAKFHSLPLYENVMFDRLEYFANAYGKEEENEVVVLRCYDRIGFALLLGLEDLNDQIKPKQRISFFDIIQNEVASNALIEVTSGYFFRTQFIAQIGYQRRDDLSLAIQASKSAAGSILLIMSRNSGVIPSDASLSYQALITLIETNKNGIEARRKTPRTTEMKLLDVLCDATHMKTDSIQKGEELVLIDRFPPVLISSLITVLTSISSQDERIEQQPSVLLRKIAEKNDNRLHLSACAVIAYLAALTYSTDRQMAGRTATPIYAAKMISTEFSNFMSWFENNFFKSTHL